MGELDEICFHLNSNQSISAPLLSFPPLYRNGRRWMTQGELVLERKRPPGENRSAKFGAKVWRRRRCCSGEVPPRPERAPPLLERGTLQTAAQGIRRVRLLRPHEHDVRVATGWALPGHSPACGISVSRRYSRLHCPRLRETVPGQNTLERFLVYVYGGRGERYTRNAQGRSRKKTRENAGKRPVS